jgi:hypothetical protein
VPLRVAAALRGRLPLWQRYVREARWWHDPEERRGQVRNATSALADAHARLAAFGEYAGLRGHTGNLPLLAGWDRGTTAPVLGLRDRARRQTRKEW